ncbi:permease [Halogeometricum pallidum]|uniref:permease n=1 Tax=Halogeometricum pallidum TaxID=411361 RepID=UPI0006779D39|nr:permease [Halogeometricum pallidum]
MIPEIPPAVAESWAFFVHLAITLIPLFIGASFVVGLAQEYVPPEKVERELQGYDEGAGNVMAAGFGAVTPFCSCSTVPVLGGLLQAGAPLGLSFSFLLASPMVNEIAVVLLLGTFGFEVALWYVVTTVVAAIVGGIVIGRLGLADDVKDIQLNDETSQPVATDGGTVECCAPSPETQTTHREHFETAAREARTFFIDTLPYLILGMTIGALVHSVVPVGILQAVLGPQNPLAVPLAALFGAPIYVSMSAMLPIAGALHEQGIAIGTVLAFIVGGAGVSIPNLILLNKLFKRRLLLIYAGTVVATGVVVGLSFNAFLG